MSASEHQKILQELREPDPFFAAIQEARAYYRANQARVLVVGGAIVALVGTAVGLGEWYRGQGRKAASDFASAIGNLEFDSPAAAEASLRGIAGHSNAGTYAALAELYLADMAAKGGKTEEALAGYDRFVQSAPDDVLRQIGLMGKAALLEKSGNESEAAATLDKASALEGPYRASALDDRARLAEKSGDKEAARGNLQKLLELQGSGGNAAEVEKRLQALK